MPYSQTALVATKPVDCRRQRRSVYIKEAGRLTRGSVLCISQLSFLCWIYYLFISRERFQRFLRSRAIFWISMVSGLLLQRPNSYFHSERWSALLTPYLNDKAMHYLNPGAFLLFQRQTRPQNRKHGSLKKNTSTSTSFQTASWCNIYSPELKFLTSTYEMSTRTSPPTHTHTPQCNTIRTPSAHVHTYTITQTQSHTGQMSFPLLYIRLIKMSVIWSR